MRLLFENNYGVVAVTVFLRLRQNAVISAATFRVQYNYCNLTGITYHGRLYVHDYMPRRRIQLW